MKFSVVFWDELKRNYIHEQGVCWTCNWRKVLIWNLLLYFFESEQETCEIKTFPCRNTSIDVICTWWKLWGKFFFFEKRAFHHLNWQLVLKRAVRYAKWASCKIQYLKLLNRMMEWRTGGSAEWWTILRCRKMEYPKMPNTFFYLTKALKNGIAIKE